MIHPIYNNFHSRSRLGAIAPVSDETILEASDR
jgi:hypothetical protein